MRREEKGEKFESWSEKYACKGDFFDETIKALNVNIHQSKILGRQFFCPREKEIFLVVPLFSGWKKKEIVQPQENWICFKV